MIRKIIYISIVALLLQTNVANAGTTGSEELKKSGSTGTTTECFEGFSRAMFKFNHALDGAVFEPVAKGYRTLPVAVRKGTSNFIGNLRSLLTLSNNILQGDFRGAGNTAGRFVINSTVGILGIWDPATAFGIEAKGKEDFGQTMGVWGAQTGCYFVLPILGPTTVRDSLGSIVNFSGGDAWYNVTVANNTKYFENSDYYYSRLTAGVDFRAKNLEAFESLEKNSLDLYASVRSLYLQDRHKRILNADTIIETQDDSDWEEIETQ